jgi:hypothetical protein
MAIKLQIRRGTAANWTSSNPTLLEGEIGYETDTGNWKVGTDGVAWQDLAYQFPYLTGNREHNPEDITTLVVDQTNDRVGIGTSSPSTKLHVEGTAPIIRMRDTDSGAGIYSEIGTSNTDGTIVISADAGNASGTSNASKIQFVIDNAATPQVTVLSDRKVGIGTASPASSIHVVSSTTTADINLVNSGTSGGSGGLSISTSSNAASITNVENSTLTFGTNNADRVTIAAGGNVGIGTTSPSTLVHVSGTAPVMRISDTSSTSNAGYVEFDCDNNDGSVAIKADPTSSGVSTSNVRIDVDGTQVARFIHAGGNTPRLSVGSETSPTANLHIRADQPVIRAIDTGNTSHVHDLKFYGTGSSIDIHANVNSASTGAGESAVTLSTKGATRLTASDTQIRCEVEINPAAGVVSNSIPHASLHNISNPLGAVLGRSTTGAVTQLGPANVRSWLALPGSGMLWGRVNSSGTILSGTGFTCALTNGSDYTFTFSTPLSNANYAVVADVINPTFGDWYATVMSVSTTNFMVTTYDGNGNRAAVSVSFVVFY